MMIEPPPRPLPRARDVFEHAAGHNPANGLSAFLFAASGPGAMILAIGQPGLAMIPVLESSFTRACRGGFTFGALITFLVIVADVEMLGIGSALWGLLLGYGISRIVEREDFRRTRSESRETGMDAGPGN
jgi:predicted benzoate:H+ symporter BenE